MAMPPPPPSASALLLLLVLALLACSLCSPPATASAAIVCTDVEPLTGGANSTVHVAVLVWLIGQPHGLFRGDLADTPATSVPGFGQILSQPYMLGVDMYVKRMRARGSILPLANGGNATINFVYINIGNATDPSTAPPYAFVDYSAEEGLPTFMALAGLASVPGTPAAPGGIFEKILSTDPVQLQAEFGIDKPFTFVVPPPLLGVDDLVNMVEDARSHIIVAPFLSGVESHVCDPTNPLTADCTSAQFGRNRKEGARRFHTQFSTLVDGSVNHQVVMEQFYQLGVRSIALIQVDSPFVSFSRYAAPFTVQAAEQLNIRVAAQYSLETGRCPEAANCPPVTPDERNKYQDMVWPRNKTAAMVAAELSALNPDALCILQSSTGGAWSIGQLFAAMRAIGWTPKAVSWGGSVEQSTQAFMSAPDDLHWTMSTRPWDPQQKGPRYKNKISETNFELIAANATHDGPARWLDAFEADYGFGSQPGHPFPHPMYIPYQVSVVPVVAYGTMMLVQKLVETAMTASVEGLLAAAPQVSAPGVYNQVQFDRYGRTAPVNEVLVQYTNVAGGTQLLAPVNIGVPAVYPLPTWKERVYAPEWYAQADEKILVAINSVCIALALVLAVLVLVHYRTPVIRAATPSFCLVIILGGVIMMTSNYFNTLVVNDAHCAAQVWLLTIGFSTIYGALFIKTFRIWRIFGDKKLQVLKLKDGELLLALCSFLLVDVLINAVWAGTAGMKARRIHVDPIRPAFDYVTCDYTDSIGAVYAHIAVKGLLLACGVVLTIAVRNTPSQFNESALIGLCIYNTSFLGGRATVYQIRAYGIMFVSMSTLALLFVPKLSLIYGSEANGVGGAIRRGGGATVNNLTVIALKSEASDGKPSSSPKHKVVAARSGGTISPGPPDDVDVASGGGGGGGRGVGRVGDTGTVELHAFAENPLSGMDGDREAEADLPNVVSMEAATPLRYHVHVESGDAVHTMQH